MNNTSNLSKIGGFWVVGRAADSREKGQIYGRKSRLGPEIITTVTHPNNDIVAG